MNALDTNRINVNSPYKVWAEGQVLHFEIENGIRYAVDFDCEEVGMSYYSGFGKDAGGLGRLRKSVVSGLAADTPLLYIKEVEPQRFHLF